MLILADDLGWADLGCYGNKFNETPQLDALAKQGMRFTQFYSGPVCSPTRANLQSGRDQASFGITQHIPGHRRPYAKLTDPVVASQLPSEVVTYAERLRDAGYATGYFGKWHLGGEGFGPQDQGWQTAEEIKGNVQNVNSGAPRRTTEVLAEKAIAFIEANRDRPFVLQVSHQAVHIPLSTTPELLKKYKSKAAAQGYPSLPEYAGLLEELDQSVGQVVAAIDRLGLRERTLILFLSDNGGLVHQQDGDLVTSNAPLRGEKGTLYEGGIRTPAIARMPGTVPAGTECATELSTQDVHATLLELAGVSPPAAGELDGISFATVLRDPKTSVEREALYWHLPHYHHSTPASAIRMGDWKLIEFFETDSVELFNLRDDLGEQTNLAERESVKAQALREMLAAWRTKVNAQMPQPNPDYDPARAEQLGKSKRKAVE